MAETLRHIQLRELSEDEGGGWLAQLADKPSCACGGETAQEAMEGLDRVMKEEGLAGLKLEKGGKEQ